MCGIVGYAGTKECGPIILEALKQLDYRGYDSAGIATFSSGKIEVRKDAGRIESIEEKKKLSSLRGTIGIGHTRWATHGEPSRDNAHPHTDCTKKIAVVHNGVIENYALLKEQLQLKGHKFESETDTEIIAHLIEDEIKSGADSWKAFLFAINKLRGSYAVAAIFAGEKEERLFCARKGSPLVLGIGKGENFCASDVPAVLSHTREFIYLDDGDSAIISKNSFSVYDSTGKKIEKKKQTVDWAPEMARKDGYPHFMLKEIHEQAHSFRSAAASDVSKAVVLLKNTQRVHVIGAGSSFHAGLVFKLALQKHAKIPVDVFIASEYVSNALIDKSNLILAISQSGETADTLNALREAKRAGCKIIALTNVVGSTITRESDVSVFMGAGPEIAVVATKTFTSQIIVLLKMAFSTAGNQRLLLELSDLSHKVKEMLAKDEDVKKLAESLEGSHDFFFIGRGVSYATALEGALKLKEITYLHAESYPAGELKHGTLSLLEKGIPVIAISASDETAHKMVGNMRECKARGAKIIAVTDNKEIANEAQIVFSVPKVDPLVSPALAIIPLQLAAYYLSVLRGKDPDKPRNLAKSVTVE
ncbi:Glutamine--fructose-6-phosphate aminotransferase [isomerizing] [Candidatus Gugararchaeum adminiculabundum]|nr:Glutamine--fructose-6-phosphate aminotransferase [isomerizing] [Candidatus Gugararchaeum adminiculabundum]